MLLLARQIMRSWLFIKIILTTESYFLDHLRQSRKKDGNFSCLLWISPNKHLSQLELKSARIKTNWKVPSSSKNYQHVIFMHESLPLSFFLVLPVCFWHGLVDKVSLVVEFQLWWVLKKAKNLHTLRKPFYFAKCQNHRKQFMLKTFFFSLPIFKHFIFWNHAQFLTKWYSLSTYIDIWQKILLFRTHHLWNSTNELTLLLACIYAKCKLLDAQIKF